MKNAMKKLMAFVLVAVMLVSAVPAAFAEEAPAQDYPVTVIITGSNQAVTESVFATKLNTDTPNSLYTWVANKHNIAIDAFTPTFHWKSETWEGTLEANAAITKGGTLTVTLAHSHDGYWNDGVVQTPATCTAAGTKLYTCICGVQSTESYGPLDHTPGAAATCTTDQTCTNCDYIFAHKLGHTAGGDATCTAPQICTVCKAEINAAEGHKWVAANCTSPRKCSVCKTTDGNELGHQWVVDTTKSKAAECDAAGETVYKCVNVSVGANDEAVACNATKSEPIAALGHAYDSVTGKCTRIGCDHVATSTLVLNFYPWYDNNFSAVKVESFAGARLYDVYTPTRYGYTFVGWYEDPNLTRLVSTDTIVSSSRKDYYAKWEQIAPHEVYVNVYINGNTKSTYAIVDLYGYAQDGVITKADIESAVKNYGLKAYNAAGLQVHGLFTPAEWAKYCADDYSRYSLERVNVDKNAKTVLYTMVHNVDTYVGSSSSSSYKADSTNPKTGDMIFAPMIVMGASASCLAVLYYLNKKRAI